MAERIYIIDAGHAGDYMGYYQTPGKRSPDGKLKEGANNRRVARAVCGEMTRQGIKHISMIGNSPIDIPLKFRLAWINGLVAHTKGKYDPVLLSFHSNAQAGGWGQARGLATWCRDRDKASEDIAQATHEALLREIPAWQDYDRGIKHPKWWDWKGRLHRSAYISMVEKPQCPAVLYELGFHTNREDLAIIGGAEHPKNVARGVTGGVAKHIA